LASKGIDADASEAFGGGSKETSRRVSATFERRGDSTQPAARSRAAQMRRRRRGLYRNNALTGHPPTFAVDDKLLNRPRIRH